MYKVPLPEELSDFNVADFAVPPVEKYTDRRGYMYILFDEIFPDYIKVGRTYDCKKRLVGYNSDKPHPTARFLYISEMFEDVHEVERRILHYMYSHTQPTTLSKEWFMIEHKQAIIEIVEKAEKIEAEEQKRKLQKEERFKELDY